MARVQMLSFCQATWKTIPILLTHATNPIGAGLRERHRKREATEREERDRVQADKLPVPTLLLLVFGDAAQSHIAPVN